MAGLFELNKEERAALRDMQKLLRTQTPNNLDNYIYPKKYEDFKREQTGLLNTLNRMKPDTFSNLQDQNTDALNNVLNFAQFYSDDRDMLPVRRQALQDQVYRGFHVPWGTEGKQNLYAGGTNTGARGIFSPVTGQAMVPGRFNEYAVIHESTHGDDWKKGLLYPGGVPEQPSLDQLEAAQRLHNDIYQADKRYLKNNESMAPNPSLWEILLENVSGKAGNKGSINRFR